jgi:photosystem II stability/assembly factor-like uncharacterized protein
MAAIARRRRLIQWLFTPLLALVTAGVLAPTAHANPQFMTRLPSWKLVTSPGDAWWIGLAVIDRHVAWAGSLEGSLVKTLDGGRSWQDVTPSAAVGGSIHDIQAFDADHVVAMRIGSGAASQIYRTGNGGRTWRLTFQGPPNDQFFFDAMAFSDNRHGLAVSDPVDGKFIVLSTSNGGRSWMRLPSAGMPAALPGEFGIASGTSLTIAGNNAWFGTCCAAARVFHSRDGGHTWHVRTTPISHTAADGSGVFSLAFRTRNLGLAVGGDLDHPDDPADNAVVSAFSLFGDPWAASLSQPPGLHTGVAWLPFTTLGAVAVGSSGSDVSYDAGLHWTHFDDGTFGTIACAHDGSCWAVGQNGRVGVLQR